MTGLIATWPGRIAALVLVAALGAGAMYVAGANTAAPKTELRTTTVSRGNVTQTVAVSGSVNAFGQARLAFKTGGRLAEIFVTTGQTVTAGQALARLDTTDLETALATAQQNLANAQASYQKQLLSANDTRQSLVETRKSAASDVAAAQLSLDKIRASYATAKTNFTSLTSGVATDLGSYRTNLDGLRTQVQQVQGDIAIYGTGDVNSAKASLNSADGALALAQSNALVSLAPALTEFTTARDALLAAVAEFDTALAAGTTTTTAYAAYQTAQISYSLAQTKLTGAVDTGASNVSSAQSSVNSALGSLNTDRSRPIVVFDTARAHLAELQASFTSEVQYSSTAKTRMSQAGSPANTMTDVVSGSLLNAMTALTTTQDRAATSIRNAESAVANIPFNLQSAQVSVDNAANAVATATSNLENAVLASPAAGIVASIANQVGEFVSGGNTNSPFVVLTNTTSMVLHGTVGEADVAKLKLGQVANVTVDALSGARMTGKVTSLDPVATISQGVPVYGIDIAVDVPAQGLRAGMSGSAAVILASKTNVLTVPNTVIRTLSGQRGVQVLKDGEVVDTVVQFGIANDSVTEVVSGLAEGDTIVIPQARATTSANPQQQRQGIGGGGIRLP